MNDLYLPCLSNMSIEVNGASLIIKKRNKETVLPISSVQSVELRAPKTFTRGTLTIRMAKSDGAYLRLSGMAAVSFGNEIIGVFYDEHFPQAKAIKEYLANYNAAEPAGTSSADEIRKYKALLDEGIISQEEFDLKKKQILGL